MRTSARLPRAQPRPAQSPARCSLSFVIPTDIGACSRVRGAHCAQDGAAQPPPLTPASESEVEDDQDVVSNYEAFEERSSAAASSGSKSDGAGAGSASQRQRRRRRATALTAARRVVAALRPRANARSAGKSVLEMLMLAFWRVLWLLCCLLFVSKHRCLPVLACACLRLPVITCDACNCMSDYLLVTGCASLCPLSATDCHRLHL